LRNILSRDHPSGPDVTTGTNFQTIRNQNSNKTHVKIYITKYALTRGILTADAEISEETPSTAIFRRSASGLAEFFHKNEWFLTLANAQFDAEVRRYNKQGSLHKQSVNLVRINFSTTNPL
jgi:hypothetical protein